eukprot:g7741.t1
MNTFAVATAVAATSLVIIRSRRRRRFTAGAEEQLPADAASSSLSRRGSTYLLDSSLLVTGYRLASADPFDGTTNRSGCINLGTAENKLCFERLRARLREPACAALQPEDFLYGDFQGAPHFREELAQLLTERMRPSRGPLRKERLVVGNGCGSLLEMWAHCIADCGEAVLVPSPYYGGFDMDLGKRAGVSIAPCPLGSATGWALTEAALESGLAAWRRRGGGAVRGLLITNPHNPLGIAYSANALRAALRFAKRHQLHVLVDEIYLLSLFDDDARAAFTPALALGADDDAIDWARVHVLWGFAKDFGASGFRVGVLATYNDALRDALSQLAYFHLVPAPTQRALSVVLRDKPWVARFVASNQAALRRAQQVLFEGLAPMLDVMVQAVGGSWAVQAEQPSSAGRSGVRIRAVPAVGGLYTWLDFSDALLPGRDPVEDELLLWKEFIRAGVYLAPGQAFHNDAPGWFRIIFAVEEDIMQLATERIVATVKARASTKAEDCQH